jgi:L-cysteine/cystine lyase
LDGVTPLLQVPPASGLVSFQLRHDAPPAEVVRLLGQQGLWIRDLADPSCLRACTHVTTTEAEAEALTTAITRY